MVTLSELFMQIVNGIPAKAEGADISLSWEDKFSEYICTYSLLNAWTSGRIYTEFRFVFFFHLVVKLKTKRDIILTHL